MRRQPNLTLIGGFVISAILLAVIGIAVLGSGKLFEERTRYVIYFNESVKGLTVGSAVTFQGVKVGEVKRIGMQFDAEDLEFHIPVTIEIRGGDTIVINAAEGKKMRDYQGEELMLALINRGMRAQIQVESFVTGRLYIELGYFPEKPVRLLGAKFPDAANGIIEVPSTPSSQQELIEFLSDLPLQDIVDSLMQALDGINRLVRIPEIRQLFKTANQTLHRIDGLVDNLGEHTDGIAAELRDTLVDVRRVLDNTDQKLAVLTDKISNTADTATQAVEQADKTLVQGEEAVADIAADFGEIANAARVALENLGGVVGEVELVLEEDSPMRVTFVETLEELTKAARSLREATDYLQRHPESILRGKALPKGKH
jgi:phospholipid/cholesterol/gamma-HCH transport system substrate-binding protein